jgi:uroporphyrinogen-III synthase
VSRSRILVTRSEPGASETGERLRTLGYQPLVEPLFVVEPIAAALPAFDALAFTSANGVRVFAKMERRRDVPVFCVGERTAEAARDAGFPDVVSAGGDVDTLTRLIGAKLLPKARLLHTGNEDRRGDLSGQLGARGHEARFVATYRATPVEKAGPVLAAHLSGRSGFEAVLVHSPRGANILADFAREAPSRAGLNVAAISPAAASPLKSLAERIEIAATPDETALLNALRLLADLS